MDELFGDKTDHVAARDRLEHVLSIWQSELTKLSSALYPGTAGSVEAEQMIDIDRTISEARSLIRQNIHPRLLVERILLLLP